MATSSLRDLLVPLYRPHLPAFFDALAPVETRATCASCAMAPPPGMVPVGSQAYFRPDVKCCSYQPYLPNYAVGALLADPDPALDEGRRRIRGLLAERRGVLPEGVAPSSRYQVLFDASRRRSFGRSLVLRCPYYAAEDGLCTIWRYRGAVCSTFFCKFDAGADGEAFWERLQRYVLHVERSLLHYARSQVAPELPAGSLVQEQLTPEELEDRSPATDTYAELWGDWVGREEEFYRRCYELVQGLDTAEFGRVLGEEAAESLEALVAAHARATTDRLPEVLVLNPDLDLQPAPEGAVACGYRTYDPLFLSDALLEVIRTLRPDETLAAAKARLAADEIELPEELWLLLYRQRVLVDPTAPT
ncbi:MAG TPA: hypothetical protein VH877_24165 [Polyangia bacterium]|jgi:Fe-S-cluster containining protein|nr:hypothetical protein [Polyangia bacterium]